MRGREHDRKGNNPTRPLPRCNPPVPSPTVARRGTAPNAATSRVPYLQNPDVCVRASSFLSWDITSKGASSNGISQNGGDCLLQVRHGQRDGSRFAVFASSEW